MIQTASFLTINNVPISMNLILEILWSSLIAAVVPIFLMLALLSFDELIDTSKSFVDRIKSAPIGNPIIWGLFGLSVGTFIFGTVFIGQLLMHTYAMGTYTALGYGVLIVLAIEFIGVVIMAMLIGGLKVSGRKTSSMRAIIKRKVGPLIH